MKTISVINYKGGVGKTTITANLAAEMAFRGKQVLAIDLDPKRASRFRFSASMSGAGTSKLQRLSKTGATPLSTRILISISQA